MQYETDDEYRSTSSTDDDSPRKRVASKKRSSRAKKARIDLVDVAVAKRLQEAKARHNELLRREGVVADDRAAQRLAVLRGQTFAQTHAAQVAAERARLTGPQLPPTHGFRIHR